MTNPPIRELMVSGKRAHLVGIGGVSMRPLAEVLHGMGLAVQGSDMSDGPFVQQLQDMGIPVTVGHNAENLGKCDLVIRTAAARDNNPEIAGAIARHIPVYERAQAWGAIMNHYQNALCIAGTHGKTTVTSMCTHIFMAAQRDPTIMIGGTLPLLHAGYRVGKGDTIIAESCEYRNSFLWFDPTVAVILNVAEDHLDFFKDLPDIQHSFRQFAERTPDNGWIVANADDSSTQITLSGLQRRIFTFGRTQTADCTAGAVLWQNGFPEFDIYVHGELYAHVALRVHGQHNVSNALAAAAAAYVLGISGAAVSQGLKTFTGAARRFEFKGRWHGADLYDDYAHHPDELHALLDTAETLNYRRVVAAFQPHTYSRTQKLFSRFVEELRRVDVAIVAEIYAARESNDIGISSADLCREIPGSVYCSTLEQTAEQMAALVQAGDLVITIGAGDIYRAGELLLKKP